MTSNIQVGCMKIMNNIRIYILEIFLLCFCLCNVMNGQKLVYLEYSETLTFDQKRLPDAQILKGNVRFKHDDMLMFCDSAYFYDKSNSIDAIYTSSFKHNLCFYFYGPQSRCSVGCKIWVTCSSCDDYHISFLK